jgi:hypothetical protein
VWQQIEELSQGNRSGQQMIQEAIKVGRKMLILNDVGLAELVLSGGWYIWWEWRSFVHGTPAQNSNRSAMSIAALTCNYMRSQNQNIKIRKGWKKSAKGKLMVNIDAGFAAGCGSFCNGC